MTKAEYDDAQRSALAWLKSYNFFVGCDGTFVWKDVVQPDQLVNEERMAFYLLRALEIVALGFRPMPGEKT